MQNRSHRKEPSKNIIFGLRAIQEAIQSENEIEKILIQKNLQSDASKELIARLSSLRIPFQKVPIEKLNKITRKNHQGFIGFLSPVQFFSIENVIETCYSEGKDPFVLILDRLTDVRNFGAIVRTAECAGIDAIITPDLGGALVSGDAMKTSAGALNYVKICRSKSLYRTIQYLKNSGLKIISCTEKTNDELFKCDLTGPLACILGSEENGINDDLLKISDQKCKIPLLGKIESLNVSVSAGIVIYEAIRQRSS